MMNSDIFWSLCKIQLGIETSLRISQHSIRCFVDNVSRMMHNNPYHNFQHAVDVAHTVCFLAQKSGSLLEMTDKERLALVAAALCHDLEHPVRSIKSKA